MDIIITRKMISSGRASLCSWISCTPWFLFVKNIIHDIKYLGFESLTGQGIKHNQMNELEQPGVWLSFLTSLSTVLKLEKGTALATCII